MEFDRDLAIQVGFSVIAVALFVGALIWLSGAYGFIVETEGEALEGTLEGEYDLVDGDLEDGPVTVTFDGDYENDIELVLRGDIEGETSDGILTGAFNGTTEGAIDGVANGTVTNGTFSDGDPAFEGDFEGMARGETSMDLTDEGGLVLIGMMAAFIILMPAFGFLIERLRSEDAED